MTYAKWHYTDHNMSKMKTDRKVTLVIVKGQYDLRKPIPVGVIERVIYSEHFSNWPLTTVNVNGERIVVNHDYNGIPSLCAERLMYEQDGLPRDTKLLLGAELETAIKIHV